MKLINIMAIIAMFALVACSPEPEPVKIEPAPALTKKQQAKADADWVMKRYELDMLR